MIIGTIDSLWRYPVKSMRGEELEELFAGYAGLYGDRLFAFEISASPHGFPLFHRMRSTSDDSLPRTRPQSRESSAIGQLK